MPQSDDILRDVLPIPDRKVIALTTYSAKDPDTKFPPIRPLRPPGGAPNVLIVLLDDVGFGASSAFGGPCQTPTAEQLTPAASRRPYGRDAAANAARPAPQKALRFIVAPFPDV